MNDFRELLSRLHQAKVEFILIGGVAAVVHGSTRLTEDVDVVYRRTPENLRRLAAALSDSNPYLRGVPPGLPFRWDERTIAGGLNFTLSTNAGAIDLFGDVIGGGGFDDLAPFSSLIQLFGHEVLCLDLEKLIEIKRAAGRPKDLESIAELESLNRKRLQK